MMKPARPTGVAVLAILDLIGGILALLVGVLLVGIGGTGILSQFGYGFYSGFVSLFGGIIVIVGVLALVVGWGMWTGKRWAWVLAIVLYALGILSNLGSLAGGSVSSIVGLLIYALLLWYMFRPHVKAFFGRGMPAQPAPTAQSQPTAVG